MRGSKVLRYTWHRHPALLMGFLTPLFLAGLAALSVPILVHLTHRARSETVPFPSLMFLQRIPYRSSRRQTLRHWLLFSLRCVALALLAFAFARPFLATPSQAATAPGGARTRVVLLDRSGSLAYGDRWTKAKDAARRALAELTSEDRASLVLFDTVAESSGEPTADRARLAAALEAAPPGFGATRYAPALRLAAEMLEASSQPRQEVVLVTDFQKTGWDGRDEVRLPAGATLTWVDVSAGAASNLAITGVELSRDYEAGRERVVAAARLVNKGTRAVDGLDVALEVDGRPVRQRKASLAANTSATVTFEPFPLPGAPARAAVKASPPDGLPHDDAFSFVLAPGGDLRVLVLESAGAPGRRSLYLRRALQIGHRPRFRVDVKPAAALVPEDLATSAVVVLNDVALPAPALGRLRAFVEKGGGVLVALGEESVSGWGADAPGLLGSRPGAAADRSSDWGGTLAHLDYAHPVFELFRGPRSGDFSTARFFRYRSLDARQGVLARFDDGTVALAEHRLGQGRALVWTSTLDTFWNDLPLQPVFLPFLH
ncbi:MAG TPA: BatA domain-containing protein, partial [Vicinamibacteria bacterium]|nr:BatA domain-containing protein [Vicinamibacteria bacterium]